ncbi:hypothetical protein CAPTEDRAFT_213431 [Capitella teleta]|uniref:Cytochrome P450 n=1 Tax=Capitella teleta TaxID=283909 RepID=R7UNA0_CAPTE|nr:hypothetical protein CAPTEDRAFT_213431 [Capitella teleta]|eukprot:ELU04871.1 hypothetical protein CAPTEDRAFT_213431 [Capitella teleta]
MLSTAVVLWSLFLTPLLYAFFRFWRMMQGIRERGRAVDKFPGEPKHWLWGHLHLYPGPNEAGLAYGRRMTAKYPRSVGSWLGCLYPLVITRHPENAALLLKSSGQNEAGLAFLREKTAKFPRTSSAWITFLNPLVAVRHPHGMSAILRSSGGNEAGLAFLRENTAKYPRTSAVWLSSMNPLAAVHHPDGMSTILRSSGEIL